jgi:hypothetical protein
MKKISNKAISDEASRVIACLAMFLGVLAFLSGCSKKEAPVPPTAPDTNQSVAQTVTAPPPKPGNLPPANQLPPVVQPNGEPDLGEINRHLLRWMMRNQRRPNSFEDFAATAGVTIPPPPAGKKYIIAKDMRIQLVSK